MAVRIEKILSHSRGGKTVVFYHWCQTSKVAFTLTLTRLAGRT